jgi:membrane protease YdiL (CAAX protease family)
LVRGYMLNNMMRSLRGPYALLITALIFTALHAFNPSISWVSVLNLFLAGMLLGVTYLRDQQLAFPIGLHLSWNFAQGPLFGFHVSGMDLKKGAVLETWIVEGSPSYLTGGGFGLEGSILLSILQILLIPVLYMGWKKMQ